MRKILPTLHILVKLGMLLAVLMLVPAAVSFYFHDGAETVFSATGLITFSLCLPVWFFTRSHHHELRRFRAGDHAVAGVCADCGDAVLFLL